MTDSITYSRPYAEAAYKIASESKSIPMWNDNLCEAYAQVHHRFPCVRSFEFQRGFITDAGAAALLSAIRRDADRQAEIRKEWPATYFWSEDYHFELILGVIV